MCLCTVCVVVFLFFSISNYAKVGNDGGRGGIQRTRRKEIG